MKSVSRTRSCLLVAAIFFTCVLLAGCAQPRDAESFALPMGYVANVQFSPFYVAQERGYFRDAGFDLTFDYRWETDGVQLVAAGEIPFAVASGDQVIQARSQGLPVVAVAGWYRTFPVGVISLVDVPLERPEDLRDLRIGIPETFGASYIGLRALLDVAGLTEADIDLQAIGYTQLAALTSGTVDAVVVYANNEPIVLAQQGTSFSALYAADYVDLVSAVIVSSDGFVAAQPETVERFVGAFLKGVSDVVSDPDAAFTICEAVVEGLSDNAAVQREVLSASVELWKAPQLGLMSQEAWAQAQEVMLSAGLIDTARPVEQLYTNAFVQGN
jgi:NitT/TauT family transport system substrate-binding protein